METSTNTNYLQKAIPRTKQDRAKAIKRLREVETNICRLETEALNLRVYLYGGTDA